MTFPGAMSIVRASGGVRPPFDFAAGTFSRTSEASYWTGAATDGSSAFLAWASSGVLRQEDRGDGNGSLILLEGARTNNVFYSEDISNAWWFNNGVLASTSGLQAPDGANDAWRYSVSTGGWLAAQNTPVTSFAAKSTMSGYLRANAGSGAPNFNFYRGFSGRVALSTTVDTTWARLSISLPTVGGESIAIIGADGRDWSGIGGVAAGTRDYRAWGMQWEEGAAFASSYIRTSGGPEPRAADILTHNYATVPRYMRSGRWSIGISPEFSSAEGITHAGDQTLFSFAEDSSERIFFVVDSGALKLRVVSGGATKVTTGALTFSAHPYITLTFDAAGAITVTGAASGNGTFTGSSWAFPSNSPTLYTGARKTGADPYFGRIARYAYAA